jgi:hypothetical protein
MDCPRCGHQQTDPAIECAKCGVILAKARPRGTHQSPGDDAPPRRRREELLTGPGPAAENIRASGAAVTDADAGAQASLSARLARLLLDDPRTDPLVLGVRGVLLLLLIYWTWTLAPARIVDNVPGRSFLHLINLPFHEAGHILFIPLGQFMMVLGGSLFQLIVPAGLTVVVLTKHRDVFGAAFTWWWTGENLLDLATYIDDARTLQLVLIGGKTGAEVEGHDWERILTTLGWLHLDHTLGRLAHLIGVVIMLSALAWALTLVVRHWRRVGPEPVEEI